jgi:hypothetical protein
MLLEKVDPRAWRFRLRAHRRGDGNPISFLLAEIFDRSGDFPVFLDQIVDDFVDRFEVLGIAGRISGWEGEDVMPAVRLRFGSDRQQVLVAL